MLRPTKRTDPWPSVRVCLRFARAVPSLGETSKGKNLHICVDVRMYDCDWIGSHKA